MPYPEIRQRLLLRYEAVENADSEAAKADEYVRWLVQAGEYLRVCWQSEHLEMGGIPLDENRTWPLWDAYTEDDLAEQAGRSLRELRNYSRRRSLEEYGALAAIFAPTWLLKGLRWHWNALWGGFVGAVGVVLFCALVILVARPVAIWAGGQVGEGLASISSR